MVGGPAEAADHVVWMLGWCAVILVVLAPIAVWKYRTRT
jgi:hypothetical protein